MEYRELFEKRVGAVNTAPFEGIKRELVVFVPTDFCCHKVVEAALFDNLRQRCRIAENIGQPHNLVVDAEFLPKETLAHKELPYERFAGCDIGICLNPHAALGFPSALSDALLNALKDFGVILLNKIVKLRLG